MPWVPGSTGRVDAHCAVLPAEAAGLHGCPCGTHSGVFARQWVKRRPDAAMASKAGVLT